MSALAETDPVHAQIETHRIDALIEAQAYVLHPASLTPSATKRVATHRVPNREFEALARQLALATKALGEVLRTVPS